MFKKILIANRGEIACRVIRTARRMGIATVAVYSQADAGALHVRLADEAVLVGPAAARESYLVADRILAACLQTGAEAVHPGYGFLSENADFAEACAAAGVTFIGPPAAAIRAMGSKSAAKALMEKAGVPLTPGYHGDEQSPAFLAKEAGRIGYPVLIKASSGGGGKGMRRVDAAADFEAALLSCQREARNAFGDDRVLVEKYVLKPRHIEIQVFGDSFGEVVYLFERDCSVQRRHQKVLEEAPAPGMTAERRAAMGKAAVDAAQAVGYVGAGTVEFITQQDGSFWFMEMNTRLQVEHPVTEMITGLDLVEWQLRVACGQPLPLKQSELKIGGHAIEARIYAENPDTGFLPSTGRLVHLTAPAASAHVRVDAGVEQGDEITPFYDPMIAKLIVWGDDRNQALARMRSALAAWRIVGVSNNVDFLRRLVATRSFENADLDTSLIEREDAALFAAGQDAPAHVLMLAALWELANESLSEATNASAAEAASPWSINDGWRLNGTSTRRMSYRSGDDVHVVGVDSAVTGYVLTLGDDAWTATIPTRQGDELQASLADRSYRFSVIPDGEGIHVFVDDRSWMLTRFDPLQSAAEHEESGAGLRAPMPGKIIALLVEEGAQVAKGTPLLIMEAMKMEHTIIAPAEGIARKFKFAIGDQAGDGDELVAFEASP